MIQLFLNIFCRSSRLSYKEKVGISCSICGIILNLFQFAVKLTVGSISGSIAVTADAVHNLSDMGSSAITLLSFLLQRRKSSHDGTKAECAAGIIISSLLFITAIQTARSSVQKLITPEPLVFSLFSVIMLSFSILIKLYMATYYYKYGKAINSQALKVTSTDCLCDSLSTLIATAAITASPFTVFNLDATGGIAVSVFIFIAATKAAADSVKTIFQQ